MKTGFFSLTAVSLLQVAQAQPAHIGGIAHRHARRDVVTQVQYVTADTPDVMVYVNQNGEPVSTAYGAAPTAEAQPSAQAVEQPATSAPAPSQAPASSQAPAPSQAPVSSQAPAPSQAPAQAPAPPQSEAKITAAAAPASYAPAPSVASSHAPASYAPAPSAAAPSSSASPSSSSSGGQGLGINYSPYHADHSCKSADEVKKDFEGFNGYSIVRSYGTDCDQVPSMISAAKSKNMQIMLGVYNVQDAVSEAGKIVSGVMSANGGDWSIVHAVTVGNEAVNSGQASASQVTAGILAARGVLLAGGYRGKVAVVDTFDALIAHPELCLASDFAGANAHAFFDAETTADQAGKWAQGTVQRVKQACGGKEVIITESGWPTQGSANGAAVPSKENQQTAMSSLKSAFPSGGLFLFSAYNDLWKTDFSGSFGCEKYWGLLGDSSN